MVQISDNASKLILKMTQKNGIPGGGLRIGIKAGGCSGALWGPPPVSGGGSKSFFPNYLLLVTTPTRPPGPGLSHPTRKVLGVGPS